MYLLSIFDHFGINVITLFIYHVDLSVQIFAQSLQTERESDDVCWTFNDEHSMALYVAQLQMSKFKTVLMQHKVIYETSNQEYGVFYY